MGGERPCAARVFPLCQLNVEADKQLVRDGTRCAFVDEVDRGSGHAIRTNSMQGTTEADTPVAEDRKLSSRERKILLDNASASS